ncbi:MAG TPA: dUTP diphosphatase [Candidatus Lustribacter sp.]|nr:dUTP diphosphatase [Candidatus Lustribacter sp.]
MDHAPPITVLLRRLDADLPVPAYALPGDAGVDLFAREGVTLLPGRRALVPTGVSIALPHGYAAFTHPRSGLAARHGVTLVNSPGTVDSGYRGEIMVNLVNLDPAAPFEIRRGDRVAQLVVQQVVTVEFALVDSLPESVRGETGHGDSGGFGPAAAQTLDAQ